jgi:hypothetical protein
MRQLIKLSAEAQAAIRESLFETLNDALIPESDRKAAAWGELYETDMYYFNLTEADDACWVRWTRRPFRMTSTGPSHTI